MHAAQVAQDCKHAGAEQLAAWCQGLAVPPGCFLLDMHRQGKRSVRCPIAKWAKIMKDIFVRHSAMPGDCRLMGPLKQRAELQGNGTLAGHNLILSGQLRFVSLRLELMRLGMPRSHSYAGTLSFAALHRRCQRSLTLEDAQILMSHSQTTDEVERGGAFAANGSVILRKSRLTAPWPHLCVLRIVSDMQDTF